jgi:phage terminase Nu1 subunit (DNA packaging protein)
MRCSGKVLSEFLGISEGTLAKWQKEGGFPPFTRQDGVGSEAAYDSAGVHRWLVERAAKKAGGTNAAESRRLARIKADRQQLALLRECGRLVDAAEVAAKMSNVGTLTREALLAIPSRVSSLAAAEGNAAKIEELLMDEIHGALVKLVELNAA